ncbi:MAG: hypothetical protein ACYTEV_00285 [Planctomycetota bacterium]
MSIALGQLRWLVSFCCLVILLALLAQAGVWAAATFGGLRFERLDAAAPAATSSRSMSPALETPAMFDPLGERVRILESPSTADPNLVPSEIDHTMELVATLAAACGRLAVAGMIPFVVLGVLLAAASATDGVDRTVKAFASATVTMFLVFPIASSFGMPWAEGALWDYDALRTILDRGSPGDVPFHVQYVVVPLAALLTCLHARHQFCAGVAAGLIRGENLRLDPVLEQEAGGRMVGSLHGVRGGGSGIMPPPGVIMPDARGGGAPTGPATRTADDGVAGSLPMSPPLPATGTDGGPPMRTTAGDAPRRLI